MQSKIILNYKEHLPLFIILLVFFIIQSLVLSFGQEWGGDQFGYIMQALSLRDGSINELIDQRHFTNESIPLKNIPSLYPWGYPLLLIPAYEIFGANIEVFKYVNVTFYGLFLITLWIFSKEFSLLQRILFVSIFAFNPYLLKFNDLVRSDIPFLFFSTLSIFLITSLIKVKNFKNLNLTLFILGISILFSFLIRTNGILNYVTFIFIFLSPQLILLSSLIFKQKESYFNKFNGFTTRHTLKIIITTSLIVFIPYFILVGFLPEKQFDHLNWFNNYDFNLIPSRLLYYFLLINEFFGFNDPHKKFLLASKFIPEYLHSVTKLITIYSQFLLYFISLIFVFIGIKKNWNKSLPFLYYSILTILLYIFWPGTQGLRFLFPILPFYIYYFFVGCRAFSNKFPKLKSEIFLPFFIILIFIVINSMTIFHNLKRSKIKDHGPYTTNAQEMFSYIHENVPINESIIFVEPRIINFFGNRNSLSECYLNEQVPKQWFVYYKKNIDVKCLYGDKLDIFLKKNLAISVFENSDLIIYKLKSKN